MNTKSRQSCPVDAATMRTAALRAQVATLFSNMSHRGLAEITCDICDGTAVLSGTVKSFRHKQIAQEILRGVDGIDRVVSNISVSGYESQSGT